MFLLISAAVPFWRSKCTPPTDYVTRSLQPRKPRAVAAAVVEQLATRIAWSAEAAWCLIVVGALNVHDVAQCRFVVLRREIEVWTGISVVPRMNVSMTGREGK